VAGHPRCRTLAHAGLVRHRLAVSPVDARPPLDDTEHGAASAGYGSALRDALRRTDTGLTLGIIFWTFITTAINEGCSVFINAAPYLKQAHFPGSVFAWRSLTKNVIQLAQHMVLFIPVAIWAGISWSPKTLFFLPGLAIVIVNLHAISITLGIACARYRDIAPIVASSLQLLMFLTPVFWFSESLPERSHCILYNPLAQFLDVLRLPLLGAAPASGTWWFLLGDEALGITQGVIERSSFAQQWLRAHSAIPALRPAGKSHSLRHRRRRRELHRTYQRHRGNLAEWTCRIRRP